MIPALHLQSTVESTSARDNENPPPPPPPPKALIPALHLQSTVESTSARDNESQSRLFQPTRSRQGSTARVEVGESTVRNKQHKFLHRNATLLQQQHLQPDDPAVAPAFSAVDFASPVPTPLSSPVLKATPVVASAPLNVDSFDSPLESAAIFVPESEPIEYAGSPHSEAFFDQTPQPACFTVSGPVISLAPDRNHCTTCKHLDPACRCPDETAAVDTPLSNLSSCFISIAPLVSKTVLPVPLAKRKRCSQTTQKFRDWDVKKQKRDKNGTSGQAFASQGLQQSVDIPLQPLDASKFPPYAVVNGVGTSYYSLVLPMVQNYRRLFTEDGVTVLPELKGMMVGLALQDQWINSTAMNSGTGRHYNDELFCKADRMAWAYNITEQRMARQLEDDAMLAIKNVLGFDVHQNASDIHRKAVSDTKPHAGYFMAIRPFSGTEEQFLTRRKDIKDNPSAGRTADLGKRFKHPFGWRK